MWPNKTSLFVRRAYFSRNFTIFILTIFGIYLSDIHEYAKASENQYLESDGSFKKTSRMFHLASDGRANTRSGDSTVVDPRGLFDQGVVKPREVETLRIHPDGSIVEDTGDAVTRGKSVGPIDEKVERQKGNIDENRKNKGQFAIQVSSSGIGVNLLRCFRQGADVYCELDLAFVEGVIRSIKISSVGSFLIDEINREFAASAFHLGKLDYSEHPNSYVLIFASHPARLRFVFRNIPSDVSDLRAVQFLIDEHAFIFENASIDPANSLPGLKTRNVETLRIAPVGPTTGQKAQ